jgi:hypothetical protein
LVAAIDVGRRHSNLSSAIRLFVLNYYREEIAIRDRRRRSPKRPPRVHAEVSSLMIAACVTRGAISLSSSSHLPLTPYSKVVKPVALPPGCARLSTNPANADRAHLQAPGFVRRNRNTGPRPLIIQRKSSGDAQFEPGQSGNPTGPSLQGASNS